MIFFPFIYLFYFLTLQYCIDFAIYQYESATGIHVFPILNPPPSSLPYPPSGSSQGTSPKHPVSCIKPGLVTHFIYDIIHVSMPFSQIIPPSPSPKESKKTFLYSRSALCIIVISSPRILNKCGPKGHYLIKLVIFTSPSRKFEKWIWLIDFRSGMSPLTLCCNM